MDNDLLRKKLNDLEEYKELKRFLKERYSSNYNIKVKRVEVGWDDLFTTKRSMKISRDLLIEIVDYRIENLKKDIENLKSGELK